MINFKYLTLTIFRILKYLISNTKRYSNILLLLIFLIDPDLENIKRVEGLGISSVELHTGQYANANLEEERQYLDKIAEVTCYAKNNGMSVRAGHGLTYSKVKSLLDISGIEELNIGHFIIGEAIFKGLDNVIYKMLELIKKKNK